MAAKLKLVADPTFKAKVGVPLAGEGEVEVEMTFMHRTRDQLDEFLKAREGKDDAASFLEMVTGWDLEEPFNEENVKLFLQNYHGAALATFRKYLDALVRAKLGN